MFTLLPPIGELDIRGTKRNENIYMNDIQNDKMCDADVLFIVKSGEVRPICSNEQEMPDLRPNTPNNRLNSKRGFVDENETSEEYQNENLHQNFIQNQPSLANSHNFINADATPNHKMFENGPTKAKNDPRKRDPDCDRAAERPTDYESGQPQKLSFENELTFIPKLNALSLKIAQSRTSIANRIKVSCESRAAALDKEMAQNFTFRPSISENSLKIADRLKTDFWTRQKLHTERQKKMLEATPTPWYPKTKVGTLPKQTPSLTENATKPNAISENADQKKDTNTCWTSEGKKQKSEKICPYTKSVDALLLKEKKTRFQDSPPQKLESLKPRALKKLEKERRTQSEKIQRVVSDDTNMSESKSEPSSPMKSHHRILSKSVENEMQEQAEQGEKKTKTSRGVHKRCKTMPPNQVHKIHRPITIDPDRFLKTKFAAEQALRNKKVFMCMGPYPVLRACLRRRGWIEKYFKADIVCSTAAQKRSPDTLSRDSDDDDDDVIDPDSPVENAGSRKGGSPKSQDTAQSGKNESSTKTQRWGFGRGDGTYHQSKSNPEKNQVETKSTYAYGTTTIGNFDDLDQGFESDSQYGIMSRIARNSVPALIWTCRRSDIEFNYLTKDQIVNHFVHASSFTTKFGLCINIRNLPWFENVDHESFFPRCHRISSDNEKQDFIDDFRMLSAIAIINHTVKRLKDKGVSYTPNGNDKILTTRALMLAMKACQEYLKSKEHLDIEEDGQTNSEQLFGLSDETWDQLIEFFYQVSRSNGVIIGAESYLNECEELLEKMKEAYPQVLLNDKNVWIVKPGAKSRGRGIMVMDNLEEILKLSSSSVLKKENKWVVQKYIEKPKLIYNTKFDIRQWFLVTDWNPLTLWFYKDCYLRFCSQEFTLNKFDPEYHLANNSIQKDYSNGRRSKFLPDDNMWTKDQYIQYLREHGYGDLWDDVIYPTMKQSIIYTLESCQDSLEYRKNSFELFGADFMLSEDLKPWLIEINCSPAMGPSTAITEKLCAEVIEDTLKVVLDRRENKSCDTGKFELAFKQQYIPIPVYTGSNLTVEGEGCKKPSQPSTSPQHSVPKTLRLTKFKEVKEAKEAKDLVPKSEKTTSAVLSSVVIKCGDKIPQSSAPALSNEHSACDNMLQKEIKKLILGGKEPSNSWGGCLCGKGEKCAVVSGYHVTNASLDVSIPGVSTSGKGQPQTGTEDGQVPARLSKQALKLAQMHRKAKKKKTYATLKYHRSNDGPGLSISPGNGVTQM